MTDRYIWHETIQTEHTRRSFLSEIDPGVLRTVQGWLEWDVFDVGMGYRCRILGRSQHCIEAELFTPDGTRLVHFGVAEHSRCAQTLWNRLGGASGAKPVEPWCVASLDPRGAATDTEAYRWVGDFERCFAWAWLTREEEANA